MLGACENEAEKCADWDIDAMIKQGNGSIVRESEYIIYNEALANYILRYNPETQKLQIIERKSKKLVQEMSEIASAQYASPNFYSTDINFDGYEDIAFTSDCGYQCGIIALPYDPKTKSFSDGGLDDNIFFGDMLMDDETKTISVITGGGIGSWSEDIYAWIDNKLVLMETYDHNDFSIYEDDSGVEVKLVLDKNFTSVGLKKNFKLQVNISYDYQNGDSDGSKKIVGYVLYDGQKEKIGLRHRHTQIVERGEEKDGGFGEIVAVKYTFEELYKGKVTGIYSFIEKNGYVVDGYYIRWKDKQRFELKADNKEKK
jgi:hypothetical protein